MKKVELNNMNAAALAYMGDAVYEQAVRQRILEGGARRVDRMQKIAAGNYVNASAQADVILKIMDELEEDELARVKRWRNYKPRSKPKSADISTYQWSTAFEALVGFLYLSGNQERLDWLLDRSFGIIENEK